MNNTITTLDYNSVSIRRTHTEGIPQKAYQMSDGSCFEVRLDYNTNQPFAVEVDYYDMDNEFSLQNRHHE